MTHRERVLTALRRQTPDRVPVDLGGTLASTINVHAYRRLMADLGFGQDAPLPICPPLQQRPARRAAARPPGRGLPRGDPGHADATPERELPTAR